MSRILSCTCVCVSSLYLIVSTGPVVSCPAPMLGHVDVLVVVEFGVGGVEDPVDDPRLKVKENSTRNIVLIISLRGGD